MLSAPPPSSSAATRALPAATSAASSSTARAASPGPFDEVLSAIEPDAAPAARALPTHAKGREASRAAGKGSTCSEAPAGSPAWNPRAQSLSPALAGEAVPLEASEGELLAVSDAPVEGEIAEDGSTLTAAALPQLPAEADPRPPASVAWLSQGSEATAAHDAATPEPSEGEAQGAGVGVAPAEAGVVRSTRTEHSVAPEGDAPKTRPAERGEREVISEELKRRPTLPPQASARAQEVIVDGGRQAGPASAASATPAPVEQLPYALEGEPPAPLPLARGRGTGADVRPVGLANALTDVVAPAAERPVTVAAGLEFLVDEALLAEPGAAVLEDPARIAAEGEESSLGEGEVLRKCSQVIERQLVNAALQRIGIDPAKVSAAMEIVAPEFSPSSPELTEMADAALHAGAGRAVERVMQTAEMLQTSERSGVQLRLDFGESGPLSVQITLRHGRVHTFFRSDSPELRESLATAWSNFVQRSEVASLPLAEPILLPLRAATTNATTDGGRFSGGFTQADSESRSDRDARSARGEGSVFAARGFRRRALSPLVTPDVALPRAGNSSHLSVLA